MSTGLEVSNIFSKAARKRSDMGKSDVSGSSSAPRQGVAMTTRANSGSMDPKAPLRGSSTGTKPSPALWLRREAM